MFGRFKKEKPAQTPTAVYGVRLEDERITLTHPGQDPTEVAIDELWSVAIETGDSGASEADVWWLLFGSEDRVLLAFPQSLQGAEAVQARLIELLGFDHARMAEAMASPCNGEFTVWRAPEPRG